MWSFSFCVSNCPRQTYISASSYDNIFLPSIWDWSFQTEVHSILEIRHVLIPFLSFDLSIKIHQKSGSFCLLCSGPVSRKCVGDLVKASSSHRSGSQTLLCSSHRSQRSFVSTRNQSKLLMKYFRFPDSHLKVHICQNSTFPPSSSKVPVFCPVCLASGADCPAAFIAQFHKIYTSSSGL